MELLRSILMRQALLDLSLPKSVLFPYCFISSMLASILFLFIDIYLRIHSIIIKQNLFCDNVHVCKFGQIQRGLFLQTCTLST
jgi:hypothetical protein